MSQFRITDVRIVPGDSGFLIDDGNTAILYDSGFGFTGEQMADRIQQQLQGRQLNYIFLTHSHYDHVLGSARIAKRFPNVKIVAGTYTKSVFQRASAKSVMEDMDRKAAIQYGYDDHKPSCEGLRVDIAVDDGDTLHCGTMHFTVLELPGHTRCSIGFYLREHELLLGTETLGVYIEKETYLPSYLVGYNMTIRSFQKASTLQPERILVPHYGVLEKEAALKYLNKSEEIAVEIAQLILACLKQRFSHENILTHLTKQYYLPQVVPVYPLDAFRLNTSIMIRLIEQELFHAE